MRLAVTTVMVFSHPVSTPTYRVIDIDSPMVKKKSYNISFSLLLLVFYLQLFILLIIHFKRTAANLRGRQGYLNLFYNMSFAFTFKGRT